MSATSRRRTEKGILITRSEIENLYAHLEDALNVIEDYFSEDTEFSKNPDDAMNEILESLNEASDILESWLKKIEEKEEQNE
jgi:lysyl-tRNA synthetase class I